MRAYELPCVSAAETVPARMATPVIIAQSLCTLDPPIAFQGNRRGERPVCLRHRSVRICHSLRMASRRIVVLAVPPVDELDLVGPMQVFNSVNRLAGKSHYTIEVATTASGLKVAGEGGVITFMARQHFSKIKGECDSVLLVCGLGTRHVRDASLSAWLKKTAGEVRRLGAVCVGSFLLAEAGLLDGRGATTHWKVGR